MRDKPLMKGLVGQSKKTTENIKVSYIKGETPDRPDEVRGESYPISVINYEVPLNKNGHNANIRVGRVDKKILLDFGFTEKSYFWEYRKRVPSLHLFNDEFVVKIQKSNNDIFIFVFDKYLNQRYDYQEHLRDFKFNKHANTVSLFVQEEMRTLIEAGIIEGYTAGDYI